MCNKWVSFYLKCLTNIYSFTIPMSPIELRKYQQIVLACEKGLYGVDCREPFGHCREVSQCSNINGTCLTGCDAGYEGVLCKRRK